MAIKIVGAHGAPRVLPKRPVPGVPVVQPRAATPSAARALAPHVQAAVSAIVQRRAAESPRAPSPAPHVQAALRSAAPPATAKRGSAIQPSPAPRAATRVLAPVIQREVKIAENQLQEAGYLDATKRLLAAAREDQRLKAVLDFVEDPNNKADLIIALGQPGSLAQTDFTIGGVEIGEPSELEEFIKHRGVKALAEERLEIRIRIDKKKLTDENRDFLQTLTHEYALHAAKFPSFLMELRSLARDNPSQVKEYAINRMRSGDMSAAAHHKALVTGSDEDYNNAKELLGLDNATRFFDSERADISIYSEDNKARAKIDDFEKLDVLVEKSGNLNEQKKPLLFNSRPRKARSCGCCFLTTACVEAMGLPEDCHELNTLRSFRDGTLSALPDGPALIARYEEIAPGVVQWIRAQPDAAALFETIYFQVIRPTVSLIEAGETAAAIALYGSAVEELNQAF